MFLHQLRYEFKNNIRQKSILFWMVLFPIVLATFFKMAFGELYEKEELFNEIPVAVVASENGEEASESAFKTVIEEIDLLSPKYLTEVEAHSQLKEGEVKGVIRLDKDYSLEVAASGIEPTIINNFLEQYKVQERIITETAETAPENIPKVIEALSAEVNAVNVKSVSSQKMDVYVQYFFNLIAMVSLFAVTSGVIAATSNQGNLSAIGARKCISPIHKLTSILAGLAAAYITQAICTVLSIIYIMFVLKINMGSNYLMIYLSGILSPMAGVSLGFFLGCIGRGKAEFKIGISTAMVMFCCFLSGLMVGNMKPIIEERCPIVNRINPAALISDLFYCLMIYEDYSKYIQTAVSLVIMTVIFAAGGFLFTRRKKYASL